MSLSPRKPRNRSTRSRSRGAKTAPRAPYLFEDELDAAFEILEDHPEIGRSCPRPDMPNLRQYLLRKTQYHVYYVHLPDTAEVRVRAVWSGRREREPEISP